MVFVSQFHLYKYFDFTSNVAEKENVRRKGGITERREGEQNDKKASVACAEKVKECVNMLDSCKHCTPATT